MEQPFEETHDFTLTLGELSALVPISLRTKSIQILSLKTFIDSKRKNYYFGHYFEFYHLTIYSIN